MTASPLQRLPAFPAASRRWGSREARAGAAVLWAARRRLLNFALCGTSTFLVCLVLQGVLIKVGGAGHVAAYIIQAAFGVQFNFMLSRLLTWRDRSVSLAGALMRYNTHQLATYGLGMALYAALDWLGMNFIVATIAVNLALTPVSFALGNRWSMAERRA